MYRVVSTSWLFCTGDLGIADAGNSKDNFSIALGRFRTKYQSTFAQQDSKHRLFMQTVEVAAEVPDPFYAVAAVDVAAIDASKGEGPSGGDPWGLLQNGEYRHRKFAYLCSSMLRFGGDNFSNSSQSIFSSCVLHCNSLPVFQYLVLFARSGILCCDCFFQVH